jgi:FMN-dependent NADH-azoreductase
MNPSQQPLAPLRILRLIASPNGDASESLKLSQRILHALTARAGIRGIELTDIDLNTLSPVDAPYAHALAHPSELATEHQIGALARSDQLISQLNACDVLVIATPMHNYSVPAPLGTTLTKRLAPIVSLFHSAYLVQNLYKVMNYVQQSEMAAHAVL